MKQRVSFFFCWKIPLFISHTSSLEQWSIIKVALICHSFSHILHRQGVQIMHQQKNLQHTLSPQTEVDSRHHGPSFKKLRKWSNCLGKMIKVQQRSRSSGKGEKVLFSQLFCCPHFFDNYVIFFSLWPVPILKSTSTTYSCRKVIFYVFV